MSRPSSRSDVASFQDVDFYRLDVNLADEERGIRDTGRRFVDRSLLLHDREHFRKGTFPLDVVPELGAMGFWGPPSRGRVARASVTPSTG